MPCIRRRMCLPDALFSEAPFSPVSVTFSNLIYSLVAFHRQRVAGEVISGRSPCHNSRMADQVTYLIFLVREAGRIEAGSRGRRAPAGPYSPNPVSTGRDAKGGGGKGSRPSVMILQRSDGVRPIPRGNPAQNRPAATLTYATTYETFSALLRAHVAMTMRDGLAKKTAVAFSRRR